VAALLHHPCLTLTCITITCLITTFTPLRCVTLTCIGLIFIILKCLERFMLHPFYYFAFFCIFTSYLMPFHCFILYHCLMFFSLWALEGSSLTSRSGVQCDEHTSHSTHTLTKSLCHQYYYSNQHRAFSIPISVLSIHKNQSPVFDLFLKLQWRLFQSRMKALLQTSPQWQCDKQSAIRLQ
jgi:hypothetical protein